MIIRRLTFCTMVVSILWSSNVFAEDPVYFELTANLGGHVFLGTTPVNEPDEIARALKSNPTKPIYVRLDKDARFQDATVIFSEVEKAGIHRVLLGQPMTVHKSVPVDLSRVFQTFGTLSVGIRAVGNPWDAPSTAIIFTVDFDGTITSSRNGALQLSAVKQALEQWAKQYPQAQVFIAGNQLSKVDYVEKIAAAAELSGLTDITIVFPDK